MINIKSYVVSDNFFAARNSHDGFKSLFPTIFSPKMFDKIYILKGGPGTGKSTLLRGVISFANEVGVDAQAVLCSSDVSSLDGVILRKENKKIALIDGTSPHTVDPIFPGAVEEIINLGEGFDIRKLEEKRSEIFYHTSQKSGGYKTAYSLLLCAKALFDHIWCELHNCGLYNEADSFAEQITNALSYDKKTEKSDVKLYSAFGKNGLYSIPPSGKKRVLNLRGNDFFCTMVLNAINKRLTKNGIYSERYASALDDRICQRLLIGDTLIIYNQNSGENINTDINDIYDFYSDFDNLYNNYTTLLNLAQNHFSNASASHLALEKIYSSAVDFDYNDRIYTELCKEIYDILL